MFALMITIAIVITLVLLAIGACMLVAGAERAEQRRRVARIADAAAERQRVRRHRVIGASRY